MASLRPTTANDSGVLGMRKCERLESTAAEAPCRLLLTVAARKQSALASSSAGFGGCMTDTLLNSLLSPVRGGIDELGVAGRPPDKMVMGRWPTLAHARVRRVDQLATVAVRSWGAHERIAVKMGMSHE